MPDRRRAWLAALSALAAVTTLSGCASGNQAGPPVQHGGRAVTWVDLAEPVPTTVDDPRQYWELLVEQSALPYWATTYVVTLPSGWTADPVAVAHEVLSMHPTLVSVEAGVTEVAAGTSPNTLGAALDQLLAALEPRHVRAVVANVPAPARGTSASLVAADDAAISASARAAGDPLVDLTGALSRGGGVGFFEGGELTSTGEQAVATAFASVFKSALKP